MLSRLMLALLVVVVLALPALADPAATPTLLKHFDAKSPIIRTAFHPNGKQVSFGTMGGMLHVRDLTDGGNDSNLRDAAGWVDYSPIVVAANPNGSPLGMASIVSLSPVSQLSIWYPDTFQRQGYYPDVGNMGAISANGRVLVVTKGKFDTFVVPMNHADPSWHEIVMPRPGGIPDTSRVTAMALDQNGALMATGYLLPDGTGHTIFWDRLTGKILNRHALAQSPGDLAYSPLREGTLAEVGRTADGKGFITLWQPKGDATIATLASLAPVLSAAFSWDAKYLAAGRFDGTIDIWDLKTQKIVSTVSGAHQGPIRTVAWAHDGSTLASGGQDGYMKLWRLKP